MVAFLVSRGIISVALSSEQKTGEIVVSPAGTELQNHILERGEQHKRR